MNGVFIFPLDLWDHPVRPPAGVLARLQTGVGDGRFTKHYAEKVLLKALCDVTREQRVFLNHFLWAARVAYKVAHPMIYVPPCAPPHFGAK
jgi:hypothetical protein